MSNPLVSVCIPTYNGAAFIGDAIRSVLTQSLDDFELLIFDDNSTDDTQSVVRSFDDSRISYFRNEQNLGPKGNWDLCLKAANGKYFKLLPHDDTLPKDSLATQVAVLEADNEYTISLIIGMCDVLSSTGDVLMTRSSLGKTSKRIGGMDLINRCIASGRNIIGEPGNGLFRTDLISEIGEYDDSFPYTIDLDYWFRVLAHGDAYYVAKVSSAFRVHQEAWTNKLGWKQIKDYYGLIKKFSNNPEFNISNLARISGYLRAAINTPARRIIYAMIRK